MKCINCNNAGKCLDHKEQPSLIGYTSGIPQRKKQTNADRIHSMNIEDLADFLKNVKADYQWVNPDYPSEDDSGAWVEWIQSEVEV